ncbi:MAG TPA: methyltransferase domain-containing protein [Pyrinomonadaceae bacterium]|jgi:SAM-dependent methyltransferase|nr:methyltransferase domain-containing protein [Pyrinomonadaceae bacterium]
MNGLGQPPGENLWGYAKRLRFVRRVIADAFPERDAQSLRVLDVGCGNATQLALPLVGAGFRLTGVDTDESSIERARSLAAGSDNARFVCGRVEQLPAGQSFDVVILSEVLEHLKEPAALLEASVGRMAEGGILIVTVPNGYGEFEMDSWMFRALRLQRVVERLVRNGREVVGATDNQECGHVQFFTRRRLARLFMQCGLHLFREEASVLFAGPLAGHTLARSPRFIEWNARITDRLPLALSSGWYFALRRKACGREGAGSVG